MKRVLSILLILLGIAQFIRPDTALPAHDPAHDLITVTQPGAAVTDLLHVACYDCHSSETRYPWYVNITPVNWWLQHHVNEGREEFNMSEWGRHKAKWQRHKAEEAVELVKKGEMPLDSYTWTHSDALLTDDQRAMLTTYFSGLMAAIPPQKGDHEHRREHEPED